MVRSSRLHRLPQRLDYTLVPAPLDLTLPLESPLPAIIVTPSSPRCSTDFSIAFLAPEKKPSWRERAASYLPKLSLPSQPISLATTPTKSSFSSLTSPFRPRSIVIMFILLFTMACHMIAHRFAITPRIDFQTKGLGLGEAGLVDAHLRGSLSQSQPNVPRVGGSDSWLGIWETRDEDLDLVVRDSTRGVADVGNGGDDVDALPNFA
ncbi:hypothetical protein BJ322DRAFT_1142908 [Thelephora terrestris]|uniref:Uncharacterized protein n=1 Tax=Thelephora terrestris TaxID=56493 RepID=A0A9P6L537_9AGAM|nr:hypothetical protein BJ322DRAFT_1142908 [Thelephora terrestris]